jgi:hypothetical protein
MLSPTLMLGGVDESSTHQHVRSQYRWLIVTVALLGRTFALIPALSIVCTDIGQGNARFSIALAALSNAYKGGGCSEQCVRVGGET